MDVLKSLEKATNSNWDVEKVDTAGSVAMGKQLVAQGDFTGYFLLVQASVWGNGQGLKQNYSVDEELANSLLGLPEGNLDTIVKRVVGEFS